ncbi:MAG TPA: MBL fold metallo-hydrolase [Vicinamibacterales bacterium]|nr:MBL fold metallo-hydrolase [Vicinamibacterales bacterium]
MKRQSIHALVLAVTIAGGASPAFAQIDLTGMWAPIFDEDQVERIPGPDVGDYAGMPITDALRFRADSWDASILTLPEHQCKPHPSTYGFRGVGNLRISADVDDKTQSIVRLRTHIQWQEQKRDIWMDGRPHPPAYAAHTWQGFSTGSWEGSVLVVRTTHLKAGWIRRNGLFLTDQATMTERFIRHGNYLTHVYMIEDPHYLSEPLVRTNGFRLTPNPAMQPYPCYPTVEVPRARGEVPSFLPGENPFLGEHAKKHNLPPEGVRGGAETALPEFVNAVRGQGAGGRGQGSRPPAPQVRPDPRSPTPDPGTVHALHVQGNVWMLTDGSVNAAVQIGDDGVLVVDTMRDASAEKMIAAIRTLAGDRPIRWIVNTHMDSDHTGGNAKVSEAGESIIAGNFTGQVSRSAGEFAQILAHENVDARMVKAQPALPQAAMPTDTFFADRFDMFFNGEAIQVLHQKNAHSDGDVLVFFRKSDVLVAGDTFVTTTFPRIDRREGGSLDGILASLNQILDITVPKDKQEGGTYVIPGHGRLADEADVVEYRDMVTIIGDRLRNAIAKSMTLEQVKASKLLLDYEGRFGGSEGVWTKDAFIEAAYGSLSVERRPQPPRASSK